MSKLIEVVYNQNFCSERKYMKNKISECPLKMSEDENRLIEDESCDETASSSRDELQNWKRWSIIILFALFNVNMSYQVYFIDQNS